MNSPLRSSIMISLSACLALSSAILAPGQVHGKAWSIDDRQAKLMQDINQGQKVKQLSIKEAKKLRAELAEIARKKKHFLDKSGGKSTVSDADKAELEVDLNKVSTDIKRYELEKRVDVSKP